MKWKMLGLKLLTRTVKFFYFVSIYYTSDTGNNY